MDNQMGQQGQGQQPQQQPQQRPPPMYQPSQIRSLPTLSEEEKTKYEQGLQGLWNKAHNSAQNSPEHLAARQKIIEFSRMLITKIQQRRAAQQQQLQQQQMQAQQQQQQQQQGQVGQQQQAQPRPQPVQQNVAAQVAAQAQPQQNVAAAAGATQANAAAAGGAPRPNAQAAAAQRPKIPDHIMNHVNKMTFRAPAQIVEKSGAEASKWVEEIKERYGRALMTMESSKQKVAQIDKLIADRAAAGNPFKEEELRQLQIRKEQQLKVHSDAHKWVDSVRKQQGNLQGTTQAAQGGAAAAPQATQQTAQANAAAAAQAQAQQAQQAQAAQQAQQAQAAQAAQQAQQAQQAQAAQAQAQAQAHVQAQNNAQNAALNVTQNTPAPVNAAVEAAKQQMAAANRASPVAGTPAAVQAQARPAQSTPQPGQQPQVQPQPVIKQEQPHPTPINAAIASAATQGQVGTPTQAAARIQTPQQAVTPVTASGPTRALSHSAAMNLANQRATSTPGSAPVPGQQPNSGTPTPAVPTVNQSVMGSSIPQQQQGHPHAHPPQPQQTSMQAKMPIPKQLPEKATAVPQGVAVGGGVNTGRPTMSQGSGTLGGVMNQPPINRIPAYNHEAEGDHVLSKKKLDELVRQVCGGSGEGQDGNLLTPEVEENVLNMADSFVDSVLHAACRNSKERGSKVLEIRDIQLVLERTYNIRVPGYSSDELRTVRKILPSAGWIAKMSAVQAAKVMPGKGE